MYKCTVYGTLVCYKRQALRSSFSSHCLSHSIVSHVRSGNTARVRTEATGSGSSASSAGCSTANTSARSACTRASPAAASLKPHREQLEPQNMHPIPSDRRTLLSPLSPGVAQTHHFSTEQPICCPLFVHFLIKRFAVIQFIFC